MHDGKPRALQWAVGERVSIGYAFNRHANERVLLVAAFSSKQERWFGMKCVNM